MIPTWKPAPTFDVVLQEATEACNATAQFNLCLAFELPVDILTSPFVSAHKNQAEKWLSDPPPRELVFSHGQFFKGKRGTDHVLGELQRRNLSRRAILAMIDMESILNSGQRSVPAFLLVQFAIEDDILYVTAYFRALEVSEFLPSNLTEIAIHCRSIHEKFPRIHRIRLFVIAFRAYHQPDFHCLEKLSIDSQPPGTIGVAVAEHKYERIREWLEGKRRVESDVQLQGIEEMLTAVKESGKPYPQPFRLALECAVESLREFRDLRHRLNEGDRVEQARQRFEQHLTDALNVLPGVPQ